MMRTPLPSLVLFGLTLVSVSACGDSNHDVAKSDRAFPGELVVVRDTDDNGRGELYIIAADGSTVRRVSSEEGFTSAAPSPNGSVIAAVRGDMPEPVVLVDVASGALTPVQIGAGSYARPVWSPTGSALAFSGISYDRLTGQGSGITADQIFIADADGGNLRRIQTEAVDGATSPSWSPDGGQLVFVYESGLWVANADGSGARPIVSGFQMLLSPVWSPAADIIAFVGFDQTPGVYVASLDGERPLSVSPDNPTDGDPAWSPDGGMLAFPFPSAQGAGLRVVRPDGAVVREIEIRKSVGRPSWSPDGGWMAFVTQYRESDGPITEVHLSLIDPLNDEPQVHTLIEDLLDVGAQPWLPE